MKAFFTILLILALVGFITPSASDEWRYCGTLYYNSMLLMCQAAGKKVACTNKAVINCICWCS